MAKVMFDVGCLMPDQYASIQEVASQLVGFFIKLSELEPSVLKPVFKYHKFKQQLNINPLSPERAIDTLATLFLKKYQGEMRQDTGIDITTTRVSRTLGFNFLFDCFDNNGSAIFSVTGFLGSQEPHIRLEYFNKERQLEFDWYYKATQIFVGYCRPLYANTRLLQPMYTEQIYPLKIKPPLGWINYFSNDYCVAIPEDLPGFEYIPTEHGKYLIFTRENFTTDIDTYKPECQRLVEAVKQVKAQVPEYSLNSDAYKKQFKDYHATYPKYRISGYDDIW